MPKETAIRIVLGIGGLIAWGGKIAVSMMTNTVYFENTFIKYPIALPITYAITCFFITVLVFEGIFNFANLWFRNNTDKRLMTIQVIYIVSAILSISWMLLLDPNTVLGLVLSNATALVDLMNVYLVYKYIHRSEQEYESQRVKIVEYFVYDVPLSLILGQSSVSALLVSMFVVSYYYALALSVQLGTGVFCCGLMCFIGTFYKSLRFPEIPVLLGYVWVHIVWAVNLWIEKGVKGSLSMSDNEILLNSVMVSLVVLLVIVGLALHRFITNIEQGYWNSVFPDKHKDEERVPLSPNARP